MAEETKPIEQRPEPSVRRDAYTPPSLVRHGTVEDLTQGATGTLGGDQTSIIP
jgi:hypothetical protein